MKCKADPEQSRIPIPPSYFTVIIVQLQSLAPHTPWHLPLSSVNLHYHSTNNSLRRDEAPRCAPLYGFPFRGGNTYPAGVLAAASDGAVTKR